MSFFISEALAEGAAAAGNAPPPSPFGSFIMLGVLFALFYFLLIRPQAKRAKEHRAMVDAVAKGDEVVTNGGMLCRVTQVGEQFLTVEVADGVSLKIQKQAVQSVMPKGTIKSA
ncbi:MAG: preprotein translocase subunit YajC [Gammaproteobacteria bacterium]|nr:preprotein translocase subunit YajC [Gammaproteobacteria bacterium]